MEKAKATIKDVAKLANVSTATVSHVINQTRYVSKEISQQVLLAMRELNYNTNSFARALRSNKSHTIGIIVPDIVNPFYSKVIHSLETAISKSGYHIILCHSQNDMDRELEQIERMHSWQAEAIVLAPSSPTFDYSQIIENSGCPIIFLDRQPNIEKYSGVFCNTHDTIRQAVEQMILSGHKRIACLLGPQIFPVAQQRKSGFVDAFQQQGASLDPGLICAGDATIENGYALMEHAAQDLGATAVFVGNRMLTVGALQYLASHGIRIPDQIAIVGFAAYDWDKVVSPPLTMVMEPLEEMGVEASDLLLSLLNDPHQEPRRVILDAHITARTSY